MGEYSDFSDTRLLKQKLILAEKIEGLGGTAFMRLLQELQIYQIELELLNRELQQSRELLNSTSGRYVDVYEFSPLAYFTFDPHGSILELNLAAAELLEANKAVLIGASFLDFIARRDRSLFLNCARACILGDCTANIEFELDLKDGKSLRVQAARVATQIMPGKTVACRMALVEVTEQRIADFKLRLTSKVLENTQEGVILTDAQQRIVAVNPAFLKTTGYRSEELIGYTPAKLKSGHHDADFFRKMFASFVTNDGWEGEIWNRRKNGEEYPEWVNIKVVRKINGEVDCYFGIYSDISNQETMKKKLKELAYYDELTGLPNRSLLYDRLQLALLHAKRNTSSLAVLFLDLDHFKEVNDSLGHTAGDFVLKEAAARLAYCVREGDTLGRLGGDEFVAILPDIADKEVPAQIAARMVNALEKSFMFNEHELHVTISIGISLYPDDGQEVSSLLKKADTAMYAAKKLGRNNFQYVNEIGSN
jgi:diguanylate cyclase (GGDEF)-like protein/PAS domain S-box-containing protein